MDRFIGRARELELLERLLSRAAEGGRAGRPGRAILIRGRRRVGKSRLVEEFVDRAGAPYVFFTASGQPTVEADLRLFTEAIRESTLPDTELFRDQVPGTWDAALRLLARCLPDDQPSVVVLDEMPYLITTDPGFEGTLQKIFDGELSRTPVLLVCVGSDLAMMEALNEYGRPFHQRATELLVPPLSPADAAEMLELPAAEAFDAYLVSGGLPLILDEWPSGMNALDYVAEAVTDPLSALLVSGEGQHMPEIERGRGDLVMQRVRASWSAWRGSAIEPVIRETLRRISDRLPGETQAIGGYWTRANDPEIDLVGADREPVAKRISFVGSIKWRDRHPFDERDLADS